MKFDKIYCVGDSHVSIFSNEHTVCTSKKIIVNNEYNVYPVWGTLAYNLYEDQHDKTKLINDYLKNVTENDLIVLMFGEVDCRIHILKHCNDNEIIKNVYLCADRYFKFIETIKNNVCIVGPHLSKKTEEKHKDIFGTLKQRYIVTKMFNRRLKQLCNNKIPFFTFNGKECVFKNKEIVFDVDYDKSDIHLDIKYFGFFDRNIKLI